MTVLPVLPVLSNLTKMHLSQLFFSDCETMLFSTANAYITEDATN